METSTLKRLYENIRKCAMPFDSDSEKQLRQLWDEGAHEVSSDKVWKRITRSLGRPILIYKLKKMSRYAAVIGGAAVIFAGGYFYSSMMEKKSETATQTYVLLTAEGSVGKYELPDGTGVWLNGGSKLVYGDDFDKKRCATLTGEGYFDVAHDPEHPFELKMNDISVEVLGTQFDACCYPDARYEDVILREGSVYVKKSADNDSIAVLKPNMRLVYNPADGSKTMTEVNAANYCSWMEERLVFDNVPLEDIIINLDRKYNAEITVASDKLKNRRFSLTVSHESFDDMIAILNTLTATRSRFIADRWVLLQ